MSEIINAHEAKADFPRLLDRAHAGEEIVLGKAGKPYARLVPLAPPAKRQLGFMQGSVDARFFEPLPDEEPDAWEGKSE